MRIRATLVVMIAATLLLSADAPPRREMTAVDVEAFLDGLMPQQLAREDIAGAVIAIVKDGQLLFAKGYGYADVASKRQIVPAETLFRPGSISKLFVWTSVMQLVEQGKLDLDKDVNQYLDFQIPPAFDKPITLRHIMTHTAGFEETVKELFVGGHDQLMPLRDYLVGHMPRRIYAAGTTPAYSNYATSLAGYIVQRVSGKPLETYVEENIFKPLDMPHSTFVQTATPNPAMSSGYNRGSDPAKSFEWVAAFPAGSTSVAALDMTHFMMAHLNEGEYNGARILKAETTQQMHSRTFALDPQVNGMALGFYEESRNGLRIIGHGGDTGYFHSDLHLIPAEHLGFFVSYNSAGKGEISPRGVLWGKFLDRYYPYDPPSGKAPATTVADGREVSGDYASSRRSETNIIAISKLLGMVHVSSDGSGILTISSSKYVNGKTRKWKEVGPRVYQDVEGQDRIVFIPNGNGFTIAFAPIAVLQQMGGLNARNLNQAVAIASIAIMALALFLWPVTAIVRKHFGRRISLTYRQNLRRVVMRMICLLNLGCVGVMFYFSTKTSDIGQLTRKLDPILRIAQALGALGAIGAMIALIGAALLWRDRQVWWGTKIQETLIALSCLAFTLFIIKWHLLSITLNY